MIFHEPEWAALRKAVVQARSPGPTTPGKTAEIKARDGSGSRWAATVYPTKSCIIRFVRVEAPSGHYPPA